MDDEKIIELLFARDERALRLIEEKYGALCRYIASNILETREDADECVSDVMLALWNAIPPDRPYDLRAYIGKAVRNRALVISRDTNAWKRGGRITVVGEEYLSILDDGTDLASDYEARRAGRIVSDFLRGIGEEQRDIFVMRYYLMESIKDISARTGFSEGKIKMLLMRMRRKLEEELRKEGILV
jgi:RNA polymerase sigma-70 factor (ECF subfamily)